MELTKQEFEQILDKRLDKIITEKILTEKLDEQTIELKSFAREQTEELARITKHGFDDVLERLDVKERVQKLEKEMSEMRIALHLS